MPYTAHTLIPQLDVSECAFFGLSGSLVSDMGVTTRHSHSLQGGNNAAGRVEKGAIGSCGAGRETAAERHAAIDDDSLLRVGY